MSCRARRTQRGFTLIEVLLASVLATASMLATLEMVKFMDRANRSVAASSDFQQLTNYVGLVFSQSDTCNSSNLIGKIISGNFPLSISPLTLATSPVVAIGSVTLGFRVTRFELDSEISRVPLSGGDFYLILNLHLEAEKDKTSQMGLKYLRSDYKVGMVVDSSNRVKSCGKYASVGGISELTQMICNQMGGAFDTGSGLCSLDRLICNKSGGAWNAGTSRCDQGSRYYLVTIPNVRRGNSVLTANCQPGDSIVSGAAETTNPGDTSQSYPVSAGGNITGWYCSGHSIVSCHVICARN